MEIILTCTVFGVFLCISFFMGAKLGQKVSTNQEIKLPTLNPVKIVKEHKEDKKAKDELDKYNTVLSNIENYDGTGNNQKEV